MTPAGGSTGVHPVTPPGQAIRRVTVTRRIADAARANEERAWHWSARVAVILPLAALVFAVTVLAIKAWPAIRVNGFYFLTGSIWNYGNSYGTTVPVSYTHLDVYKRQWWPRARPGSAAR